MRDNEKDAVSDGGGGVAQVSEPNYHMKGHTACQTCGYTKKAVKGETKCYKYVFYGIESHRCIQMTPVVRCNERCVFCWRDHQGHSWELDAQWDDPEEVVDASIELQRELLGGFKGNDDVTMERFEQAMNPRHVAISLDGEPTLYPYLPELIEEFHNRDITTFLVSNGTSPEVIESCSPTQLYVSVDGYERGGFNDLVKPLEENAWDQLMETMDVLRDKDSRTVIRSTLVKDWNMDSAEGFASVFRRAEPDFIELKGYMHVGHSRKRLGRDAMPSHDEILGFSKSVKEELDGYDVLKQVPRSNVVLLARDEDTWVEKLKPGSEFWRDDDATMSDKKKVR